MMNSQWIGTCAIAFFIIAGCITREKMDGVAMTPAAQGKITADKGSGGNTELEVEVKHLAQAEKVSSGARDYVIWIQPEGSRTFQNIGVLEVGDDLESEYRAIIPYSNFRVVVTPEPDRMGTQPTGPIVLDQFVFR